MRKLHADVFCFVFYLLVTHGDQASCADDSSVIIMCSFNLVHCIYCPFCAI